MNQIIKIFIVLLVFGFISCRDTKEDEETKAAIEKIETIEKETEEISKEIEKESKEIEKELNNLDNL